MTTLSASRSTHIPPLALAVIGALLATTLDITFASVYWVVLHDVAPARVMQSIAAYWGLGRDAYAGGTATAALGAALFFARMILLAVIYQAAARRYALLIERPFICGALFGLAVYLTNEYLVVPMIGSMAKPAMAHTDWAWTFSCMLSHMVLIGIPLALFARAAVRDE